MDFASKHIGFVLASYGVAFVLLGVLIGAVILRMRAVRKRLAELEAQGASRRAPAATSLNRGAVETTGAPLVEGREAS